MTELSNVKTKRKIIQIFVAFPENLNFILGTEMGVRVREREGKKMKSASKFGHHLASQKSWLTTSIK